MRVGAGVLEHWWLGCVSGRCPHEIDCIFGLELCHSYSPLFVHCLTLSLMCSWCSANIYGLPLFHFSVSKMQKKSAVTIYVTDFITFDVFPILNGISVLWLLKSSVGMGWRVAWASFHIYTLSLTSFFPFPCIYFCRPNRATLYTACPGSVRFPSLSVSELK